MAQTEDRIVDPGMTLTDMEMTLVFLILDMAVLDVSGRVTLIINFNKPVSNVLRLVDTTSSSYN